VLALSAVEDQIDFGLSVIGSPIGSLKLCFKTSDKLANGWCVHCSSFLDDSCVGKTHALLSGCTAPSF